MSKTQLVIEFQNEKAAQIFGTWLCELGEQDYWNWMEYREEEQEGNITAVQFEYYSPIDEKYAKNDEKRYKNSKFLGDFIIKTECGRLDHFNEK
jgi:hypothetical protein